MANRHDIYNLMTLIKGTKGGPYFSKSYILKTLNLKINDVRKFKINNIFNDKQ